MVLWVLAWHTTDSLLIITTTIINRPVPMCCPIMQLPLLCGTITTLLMPLSQVPGCVKIVGVIVGVTVGISGSRIMINGLAANLKWALSYFQIPLSRFSIPFTITIITDGAICGPNLIQQ